VEQRYRPFKPCIYPSVCDDCDGLPEGVAVYLRSGERLEFNAIDGIELTGEEIVLHAATGESTRFPREDVVYAGCSRVLPPPLS
jgi:hypothetical protein